MCVAACKPQMSPSCVARAKLAATLSRPIDRPGGGLARESDSAPRAASKSRKPSKSRLEMAKRMRSAVILPALVAASVSRNATDAASRSQSDATSLLLVAHEFER